MVRFLSAYTDFSVVIYKSPSNCHSQFILAPNTTTSNKAYQTAYYDIRSNQTQVEFVGNFFAKYDCPKNESKAKLDGYLDLPEFIDYKEPNITINPKEEHIERTEIGLYKIEIRASSEDGLVYGYVYLNLEVYDSNDCIMTYEKQPRSLTYANNGNETFIEFNKFEVTETCKWQDFNITFYENDTYIYPSFVKFDKETMNLTVSTDKDYDIGTY